MIFTVDYSPIVVYGAMCFIVGVTIGYIVAWLHGTEEEEKKSTVVEKPVIEETLHDEVQNFLNEVREEELS